MNILIIDDDSEDIELFCEALYEVLPEAVCHHKDSCRDIDLFLKEHTGFDLIFIDGHMQPMTGRECYIKLSGLVNSSTTKIVIYTGSLSPLEKEEFKSLGVYAIMQKAPSFEMMKNNLREVFSRITNSIQ
jgi:CheY-like chemotaxis protein